MINNSATANLSNLNGGEYSLMVTDANGCKTSTNAQLTMPTPKDWSRSGNANIDPAEFIGSTDASDVVFKSNNQEALRLAGNGNVGVKNANPTEALDVIGNMKTSGTLKFANNGYISPMVDATGNSVGLFFGSGSSNTNSVPVPSLLNCLSNYSWQTNFQHIVAISDPSTTGLPSLYLGSKNGKALIESSNQGTTSLNTKLYLNFFCGEDVLVGNSAQGNLIATVKLGVGTYSPTERLHVVGSGLFDENLYVTEKIGIGTNTPTEKLEVNGNSLITGNSVVKGRLAIGNEWNGSFYTVNTDYQLCVNGKIVATEILVKERGNWPDYVFKKDYKLKSIKEVNNFIKKHGHLPDAPTAKEVEVNGINTGEMLNLQMQKIEELTLYIIDLQKQIDALKQAKN